MKAKMIFVLLLVLVSISTSAAYASDIDNQTVQNDAIDQIICNETALDDVDQSDNGLVNDCAEGSNLLNANDRPFCKLGNAIDTCPINDNDNNTLNAEERPFNNLEDSTKDKIIEDDVSTSPLAKDMPIKADSYSISGDNNAQIKIVCENTSSNNIPLDDEVENNGDIPTEATSDLTLDDMALLDDTVFDNNGSVYIILVNNLPVDRIPFLGNCANANGEAIYVNFNTTYTLTNSIFNNDVERIVSAIYARYRLASLSSNFSENNTCPCGEICKLGNMCIKCNDSNSQDAEFESDMVKYCGGVLYAKYMNLEKSQLTGNNQVQSACGYPICSMMINSCNCNEDCMDDCLDAIYTNGMNPFGLNSDIIKNINYNGPIHADKNIYIYMNMNNEGKSILNINNMDINNGGAKDTKPYVDFRTTYFENDIANDYGVANYSNDGFISVEHSNFTNNCANDCKGATYCTDGLTLWGYDNFIANNSNYVEESEECHCIAYGGKTLKISKDKANSNEDHTADCSANDMMKITGSNTSLNNMGFQFNQMNYSGAALNMDSLTIDNSKFQDKDAVNDGSAIYIDGDNPPTVKNCILKNNYANDCEGASQIANANSNFTLKNNKLINNYISPEGQDVHNSREHDATTKWCGTNKLDFSKTSSKLMALSIFSLSAKDLIKKNDSVNDIVNLTGCYHLSKTGLILFKNIAMIKNLLGRSGSIKLDPPINYTYFMNSYTGGGI